MVVAQLPYLRITDPVPTKEQRPYGLFSVAPPQSPADTHWMLGVEYQPLCGGAGSTFDFCVTGAAPPVKAETSDRDLRGAQPFTVYAEVDCAPVGDFWERGSAIVERLLTENEQYQVERAVWTGQAGGQEIVYPHLAANTVITNVNEVKVVTLQTAATIVTGSAGIGVSPARGIGLLEAAGYGCYRGTGVIYAPVLAVPSLVNQGMIYRDGARLRTINGSYVVSGGGFANTGPDGSAAPAGTAWLYFTGQPFIYRGSVRSFMAEQSLDRSTNMYKAIAERTYLFGWDCCHYAVLINV